MPANYAHYRFGVEMLGQIPGDIRRTVNRFRRLYDVGLHGADIFFYYNPVAATKVGAMGERLHKQSGADFFTRICRGLRMEPSEAGEAYLYGLLTHYCLDSMLHPYILQTHKEGVADHVALEAELDRYLLEKDGKVPPCQQDMSNHMKLTAGECETVAKFYSGVKPAQVRTCLRNMALITKTLAMPDGKPRELVQKGIGFLSKENLGIMIPVEADPALAPHVEELLARYEKAKESFPELVLQLSAHMTYNGALGEDFALDFGF